jgi:predicted nuclease of predicted toxin-antitoxin system
MAPRFLKILTDENISPRVVSFLRGKGLDVIGVKENESNESG